MAKSKEPLEDEKPVYFESELFYVNMETREVYGLNSDLTRFKVTDSSFKQEILTKAGL